MTKFSGKRVHPNVTSVIRTTPGRAYTSERMVGYSRDAKSELFLLAVANMVGEDTFYEKAADRDHRFRNLVVQNAQEDPEWTRRLIVFMRKEMNLRSAPIVAAAHYIAAEAPGGRQLVAQVLARADEPAELLAFWMQEYGRSIPKPLKRGVADAIEGGLYNERTALRYDGQGRAWRMGDVIDLVHPKPDQPWQSALYRYLLDTRHGRDGAGERAGLQLPVISLRNDLEAIPPERRRQMMRPEVLTAAGASWEWLSGWLQGPMDAQAWEAIIPSMGYMALLRNLRNFEQAGISEEAHDWVAAKIADPEQVQRSKQFPFRFLSAYNSLTSERYSRALERALEASLQNVPRLSGRTLILIDLSGSMRSRMSGRSKAEWWQIATLFGMALGRRAEQADVYGYSDQFAAIDAHQPILRSLDQVRTWPGAWRGTSTAQTLAATLRQDHDRVVIVTDEQAHPGIWPLVAQPVFTFNIGGYRVAQMEQGEKGRYAFGGLNDNAFKMLAILAEQRKGDWPF